MVTNTGNVPLANVTLSDSDFDLNGAAAGTAITIGNLAVGGTYTTTFTAPWQPGQHTDTATASGSYQDSAGNTRTSTDTDDANYFGRYAPQISLEKYVKEQTPPPPTADLCPTSGKPESLTFRYLASNTFNPLQLIPNKAQVIVNNGMDDDDDTAYVVVSSSSTAGSGTVFFRGSVKIGADFVASKANAGGVDFGSNTFIYFYDLQGGPLLQEVQYHTSCSAPIILGAQVLGATLVGYDGVTGGPVTLPPPDLSPGDRADTPPGPRIPLGSAAAFTYEVTNPGAIPLSRVMVVDDNHTPGNPTDDFQPAPVVKANGKNVGDTNDDGKLDPSEKWLYTARETVTILGVNTNLGTATGEAPQGERATASDPANYTGVPFLCPEGSSTIESNFNGTSIAQNNYIWFNSVFQVSGLDQQLTTTLTFQASKVTFRAGGTDFVISIPNSIITYSPAVAIATTTYNVAANTWITQVPSDFSGNVFLSGIGWRVPVNLPGGINPVSWAGHFTADQPGVSGSWKWAAAVYTTFTNNPTLIGVKPIDGDKKNPYPNSDHAGTPENFKRYVIGGARGGGGSNWTGSYSGTASVTPCPPTASEPPKAAIDIEKATNGQDADSPTGPILLVGSPATFTYTVRNFGSVPLSNVTVKDDNGTPGVPGDDFSPQFVVGGDTGNDGVLGLTEVWQYTASRTVTLGQYANISLVTGRAAGRSLGHGRRSQPSFRCLRGAEHRPAEVRQGPDAAAVLGRSVPTIRETGFADVPIRSRQYVQSTAADSQ